jgi:hypothetical protein
VHDVVDVPLFKKGDTRPYTQLLLPSVRLWQWVEPAMHSLQMDNVSGKSSIDVLCRSHCGAPEHVVIGVTIKQSTKTYKSDEQVVRKKKEHQFGKFFSSRFEELEKINRLTQQSTVIDLRSTKNIVKCIRCQQTLLDSARDVADCDCGKQMHRACDHIECPKCLKLSLQQEAQRLKLDTDGTVEELQERLDDWGRTSTSSRGRMRTRSVLLTGHDTSSSPRRQRGSTSPRGHSSPNRTLRQKAVHNRVAIVSGAATTTTTTTNASDRR